MGSNLNNTTVNRQLLSMNINQTGTLSRLPDSLSACPSIHGENCTDSVAGPGRAASHLCLCTRRMDRTCRANEPFAFNISSPGCNLFVYTSTANLLCTSRHGDRDDNDDGSDAITKGSSSIDEVQKDDEEGSEANERRSILIIKTCYTVGPRSLLFA